MQNQVAEQVLKPVIKTVYRRELPQHLISFSSTQGKKLFLESLQKGTMEDYFNLAEQYTTQAEPEYCGPASLIMILNALNVDPSKPWKGIWRWFTEEVLHCSTSEMMKKGMDLEQLSILARCNGLHTQTFRPLNDPVNDPRYELILPDLLDHKHHDHSTSNGNCCNSALKSSDNNCQEGMDLQNVQMHEDNSSHSTNLSQCYTSQQGTQSHDHQHQTQQSHLGTTNEESLKILHHNTSAAYIKRLNLDFLRTAILASSRRQGLYIMANMSRKTLNQTGDGHFTPIGGYNQPNEKVLLFDTARYKYPPHWVDVSMLYDSINTIDKDTGKLRGIIAFSEKLKFQDIKQGVYTTITKDLYATHRASKILCQQFRPQVIEDSIHAHKQILGIQTDKTTDLDLKLLYIMDILNDIEIRSILFVYLHEVINRFGFEDYAAYHKNERYYLSEYLEALVKELKNLPSHQYIFGRKEILQNHPFLELTRSFIPGYELKFLSVILHSLPKQIFYRLRIQEHENSKSKRENLWDIFLQEDLKPIVKNEINIIRHHLDIQSEYCHISDYSECSNHHHFHNQQICEINPGNLNFEPIKINI